VRKFSIFSLLAVIVFLCCAFDDSGCGDSTPPADKEARDKQEQMQQQEMAQTGMPGITNFTEAKLVKHLYELRDQKIVTYSYIPDMNGKLWHLCNSIGYGLPYGVQFSNPEKITQNYNSSYGTLPQAEPNGLYMPPTAEGTWIICSNPDKSGDISPVYVEPRVIVSPFKLNAAGEYALQ
jgi:hypothetical protein